MSQPKPNILLLSGYHAASHKYWCEQLVRELPEFNWTQVELPDRHFYWRIRSNALSLAFQHTDVLNDRYDLLVATSMVDLCNLRGLQPQLSRVPSVLYFHENQFAYPERKPKATERKQNSNLINAQLTSVYSALVADKLVFNSRYNRDSFLRGAAALFAKMPDGTPADFLDHLPGLSEVIPVPISRYYTNTDKDPFKHPVQIVWNHRWEYDKQPQVFFAAIERLISDGYEISLHVMGQSFRETPDCFAEFRHNYANNIVTWGHQPFEEYMRILKTADIAVSAALHDFQGLGMLEAIAAGCIAVAPNRMAYPEYLPDELLYEVGDNEDLEVQALYQKLLSVIDGFTTRNPPEADIDRYMIDQALPKYRKLFKELIG